MIWNQNSNLHELLLVTVPLAIKFLILANLSHITQPLQNHATSIEGWNPFQVKQPLQAYSLSNIGQSLPNSYNLSKTIASFNPTNPSTLLNLD